VSLASSSLSGASKGKQSKNKRRWRISGKKAHLDHVRNDINVTPLVDVMLVLLIIFMLMTLVMGRGHDVKLPNAKNVQEMLAAPMVAVAGDDIYVDSKPAGTVLEAKDAKSQGKTSQPAKLADLETKLKYMKETWMSTHPAGTPFPGMVILQLDENLEAFIVKSVFYTCALSGYNNISFMVNKKGKTSGSEGGEGAVK